MIDLHAMARSPFGKAEESETKQTVFPPIRRSSLDDINRSLEPREGLLRTAHGEDSFLTERIWIAIGLCTIEQVPGERPGLGHCAA